MFSTLGIADTYVKGYTRKNGTYVAPHYRSSSNSTAKDNWSTKGNVNPYTGKRGTKVISNDSFNSGSASENANFGSDYSDTSSVDR